MRNLQDILFGAFSRRDRAPGKPKKQITRELKDKIFTFVLSTFGGEGYGQFDHTDRRRQLLAEIEHITRQRSGSLRIHKKGYYSTTGDIVEFLYECEDPEFLNFLEDIFRTDVIRRMGDIPKFVADLNLVLESEDSAYMLTSWATELADPEPQTAGFLTMGRAVIVVSKPRIILRENPLAQSEIVSPALSLLEEPGFSVPNEEFIEALRDYRLGAYADSLTKCASAFESVLKVVCKKRRWPYVQKDRASKLIQIVSEKMLLPGYVRQQFTFISELRNNQGSAHGGGTEKRAPSKATALYAVNATASAILFVVQESGTGSK